jgi:hypothetical protein
MKRICCLIFIIFAALLVTGCIEKLETPEWDVNLQVPVINKSYPVYDLEDSVNIVIDDSVMYYKNTGEIRSFEVGSDLLTIGSNTVDMQLATIDANESGAISMSDGSASEEMAVRDGITSEWFLRFKIDGLTNSQDLEYVKITFQNVFESADAEPYYQMIDSNFSTEVVADLGGYLIKDDNLAEQEVLDSLRFTVEVAAVDGVVPEEFELRISYNEIKFSYLEGKVFNKQLDVNDDITNITVEYPYGIENTINAHGAKLMFEVDNPIGFDCTFYGKITAKSETNGITNTTTIDETDEVIIQHASNGNVEHTTVILQGPEIDDLLNTFPEEVRLEDAHFIIGRRNSQGETVIGYINSGVSMLGYYESKVPFELILMNNNIGDSTAVADSNYVQPRELQEIEISSENQTIIEDRAKNANMVLRIENSVPAGATAHLYFSDNEDDVFDSPLLKFPRDGENTTFDAASEDMTSGEITPTTSEVRINLSNEDLQTFLNDKLYLGLRFVFMDSDGEAVVVKPEDYIKVIGRIELLAHISEEE